MIFNYFRLRILNTLKINFYRKKTDFIYVKFNAQVFKSTPILSLKEETLKKKDEFADDFDIIFKNEQYSFEDGKIVQKPVDFSSGILWLARFNNINEKTLEDVKFYIDKYGFDIEGLDQKSLETVKIEGLLTRYCIELLPIYFETGSGNLLTFKSHDNHVKRTFWH